MAAGATSPLPAVAILQDDGYVLRHTSPHGGTLGAIFCKMADFTHIYSQVSTWGTTPRKFQVMSYWGPCPTKVRLCLTHPHDGTPVAILEDGGLSIYSSSLTVGYVITIRTEANSPRAFAAIFGGQVCGVGFLPHKTQNSSGLLPPVFWGCKFGFPLF